MLILALILYYASVYNTGIAAPVISSIDSDHVSPFFIRDTETPDVCPRKRIEIIWSCIATILAASWVSVHPNLPHPKDSKIKKTLRRIELMLWAIITPELIIFWAMRQWYGARKMEREFAAYLTAKQSVEMHQSDQQKDALGEITLSHVVPPATLGGSIDHSSEAYSPSGGNASNVNVFKWTHTHGFFSQMGGFVLVDGKKRGILGWERLMEHYKAGRIDLSNITEDRINDHSKADGFAKGLALLQTCWFIVQCIARFADRHLVLTELELVTAALAVLSLFMYFLWWNKPFNAEIPIVITLSSPQTDSSTNSFNDLHQEKENKKQKSLHFNLKSMLWVFRHIWKRISDEILTGNGNNGDDLFDNSQIMKVPTFYSISADNFLHGYQMVWASFSIAALFGAIHCAGWSSKILFSSHATSLLWRISSVIITGSPLVWSLFIVFGYAYEQSEWGSFSKKVYKMLEKAFMYLSAPTIPLYIISQIILLILAFVELRDLPPGAMATIQWANVVPFIH